MVGARSMGRALGVALVVGVGCGGGAGGQISTGGTGGNGQGGAGGSPASVALASFGQAFEEAYCGPLVACGVYPDLTNCQAGTLFAESNALLTAVGAVGRGTSHYDPTAAAACIAALPSTCIVNQDSLQATLSIDAPFDLLDATMACANVFTGLLGQGDSCQSSVECAANVPNCSPIDQTSCTLTSCCPGTCQPIDNIEPSALEPHTLGEDCTDNNLCWSPAVCSGTCNVPPAEGATCDPSVMFPCQRLDDFCDVPAGATMGTCDKRLALGVSCESTKAIGGCVLDGRCDGDSAGNFTCTGWHTLGGSCSYPTACVANLTCSTAGACAPVTGGVDCGAS